MRLSTRKRIKQAAQWAAFFVLSASSVLAASFFGAEMAGASSQAAWAMAKLGMAIMAIITLIGCACSLIEDN